MQGKISSLVVKCFIQVVVVKKDARTEVRKCNLRGILSPEHALTVVYFGKM
jgi:hypothetical protein